MIAYRGIIGSAMRTVRPFTLRLAEEWTLLMHSDGISARADLDALDVPTPWDPAVLAQAVLDTYARQHDDALAVIAMLRR